MLKTPLFSQMSLIAILGTQGVIFQGLTESVEIKTHNHS